MIMLLAIFYCFSFFIRRSKGRFPKEKRRKKKALRPMASGQPESYKSQRVASGAQPLCARRAATAISFAVLFALSNWKML